MIRNQQNQNPILSSKPVGSKRNYKCIDYNYIERTVLTERLAGLLVVCAYSDVIKTC